MEQQKYNLEKQHLKGKLHAIERINILLDKNSFHEIGSNIANYREEYYSQNILPYDGVITGYGYIEKKLVYIYSQDFTICGGTVGKKHGEKIAYIIRKAIENECPVIGINDSGGARIQEGVNALAGYGEIFYYNTLASGYIPQIMIIAGPCAGGAVYSPGIADFIFMVNKIGKMFVTGPKVINQVTGETCTEDELGGAQTHASQSGVAHFVYDDEKECLFNVRKLVDLLPQSAYRKPILENKYIKKFFSGIANIIPKNQRKVYNMTDVIKQLLDENTFLEIQSDFAKNIIIGFGKICKVTVGIVANQPQYLGGILDCDSSDKAARFVRFCDAYDIPIITLVDVPGFMPSVKQEKSGIIRHGAKLLYAYSEATTIKLTVIVRKAFGGAYIAMGSKHLGADFVYAWPTAEISVMGAEGAINIIYGKELKNMSEKEKSIFLSEKLSDYENKYMSSAIAAYEGYIDEIIDPNNTRERLYADILSLIQKNPKLQIKKKHGNIPL